MPLTTFLIILVCVSGTCTPGEETTAERNDFRAITNCIYRSATITAEKKKETGNVYTARCEKVSSP